MLNAVMKPGTFEFSSMYSPGALAGRNVSTGKENARKIVNNLSGEPASDSSCLPSAKKQKRKSKLSAVNTSVDDGSKVTSTPKTAKNNGKQATPAGIESILKSAKAEKSILHRSASGEINESAVILNKPKKRNKSVSFVLDDSEVATKKSKKSSDTLSGSEKKALSDPDNSSEAKQKARKNKRKKKRRHNSETEVPPDEAVVPTGEPTKKKKKQMLAENIAENLENLSIGDNASTLAGLLDDMKVAEPVKRKNKKKERTDVNAAPTDAKKKQTSKIHTESNENGGNVQNKEKTHKRKKRKRTVSPSDAGAGSEPENQGAEVEKVKWGRRKWNKDRRGEMSPEELHSTVIVENLPLSFLLSYKKLLTDHFSKYGAIRKIGIVEVYPTEESRPVFTTTLQFTSTDAATQALEEDNMQLMGSRMRVKRPLPATETTVVVRSYGGCEQQHMSSIFATCGKIRSIREVNRGSSCMRMPSAFVEFDGPDAVEKALKMAAEAKIGSKKVVVHRFEDRSKIRKDNESKARDKDSDREGDSS